MEGRAGAAVVEARAVRVRLDRDVLRHVLGLVSAKQQAGCLLDCARLGRLDATVAIAGVAADHGRGRLLRARHAEVTGGNREAGHLLCAKLLLLRQQPERDDLANVVVHRVAPDVPERPRLGVAEGQRLLSHALADVDKDTVAAMDGADEARRAPHNGVEVVVRHTEHPCARLTAEPLHVQAERRLRLGRHRAVEALGVHLALRVGDDAGADDRVQGRQARRGHRRVDLDAAKLEELVGREVGHIVLAVLDDDGVRAGRELEVAHGHVVAVVDQDGEGTVVADCVGVEGLVGRPRRRGDGEVGRALLRRGGHAGNSCLDLTQPVLPNASHDEHHDDQCRLGRQDEVASPIGVGLCVHGPFPPYVKRLLCGQS